MKYKNNLTLTNPRRVPFSLSNQFDDTFGLTDMVSDCKNAEDFCAAANKYDRFHLKWKIDKDSKNETRLTLTVRVKSRQRFCQNFLRILDLMLCQCSKIRMILGNYMKNGS